MISLNRLILSRTCKAPCTLRFTVAKVVTEVQDLMNGKVIYHNLMSILMLGVNSVMEQRTGQLHGSVLEEAICLSFKILFLAFSKDTLYAEAWSPVYQACLLSTLYSILTSDIQNVDVLISSAWLLIC